MNSPQGFSILTLRLRNERHVVQARQRARDIAGYLGFDHQEQTRLATATSELARNAFRYATGGAVEFLVQDDTPQLFLISVTDSGPGIPNLDQILRGQYISKTGLGNGILGTKRLMEHFRIVSSSSGTRADAGKSLPLSIPKIGTIHIKQLLSKLSASNNTEPFEEIERQNQELLKALSDLGEQQEILAALNRELEDTNQELEDTNRGVVALYAELDQRATDLRRISDLKTSFISNLSHEFRTPLNSISSLSRMLLNRTDGDLGPEQEKQVTYIQRSASDLAELVNDLLDLAKVEAGKVEVKTKSFTVEGLFSALRGMLRPLLVGNSLDLIFESDPALPSLYTDEGKISQILRNLIANALKFTQQGQVRVTAEAEAGDQIVFRVFDTGIGIASCDLKRIFDEFAQVDGEIQRRVQGTGLGLPLSRRLAELLGGTLEVESEPLVGSTFIARLPMYLDKPQDHHQERVWNVQASGNGQAAGSSSATGPTILFIEDNQETIFVHETSLRKSNYRLVFVGTLEDARAALEQETPALVVLDRLIEKQDCLFYIAEMRTRGFTGPVLVVSVLDEPKPAMDAGATAFLAKPIAHFTLLNMIRELVDGKSSRTILLSDDDEVTRYLLGEALANAGFRILEARNGRDAVRMAEAHRPHAMFLDVVMPGLDGFEVLREIRSNPLIKNLPIIVHSSKALSTTEVASVTRLGAVLYPKAAFGGQGSADRLHQILNTVGINL